MSGFTMPRGMFLMGVAALTLGVATADGLLGSQSVHERQVGNNHKCCNNAEMTDSCNDITPIACSTGPVNCVKEDVVADVWADATCSNANQTDNCRTASTSHGGCKIFDNTSYPCTLGGGQTGVKCGSGYMPTGRGTHIACNSGTICGGS